ncbi:hypothetical protein OMB55_00004800 [gamma proteobacterium HIMB55]|nr:hypothetical protein OMB55_00004800 [gamma proteobacterium HIMB55]
MALRYFEFTPVVKVDALNGPNVFWERFEGVCNSYSAHTKLRRSLTLHPRAAWGRPRYR